MTQKRSLISTRRCTVAASESCVQFEGQRDIGEADRRFAIHAQRAARVPVALRDNPPAPQLHATAVATALTVTPRTRTSASNSMSAARPGSHRRRWPDATGVRRRPRAHSAADAIHIEHGLGARQVSAVPAAPDNASLAAPAARAFHSRPSCRDPVGRPIIATCTFRSRAEARGTRCQSKSD